MVVLISCLGLTVYHFTWDWPLADVILFLNEELLFVTRHVLKCLEIGVVFQAGFPGWLWPAGPHPSHPIPSCCCLLQVVGVPVGSALQSTVKQAVAISGGQILVAKSSSSAAKAVGSKQVVTQGVAKAIVSGGGGTIVAQPVQTITKAQVSSTGTLKSTSQGSGRVILHLVNS